MSVCRIGKGPRNPPRITAQALWGRVPQAQAGAEVWAEAAGALGSGAERGSLRGHVRGRTETQGPALHVELSERGLQPRFPGSAPPTRRVPCTGRLPTVRPGSVGRPGPPRATGRGGTTPGTAAPRHSASPPDTRLAPQSHSRLLTRPPAQASGVEWACPPSPSLQRNSTVFTTCLPKEAGSRWLSGWPPPTPQAAAVIPLSSPRPGASARPGRAGRVAWEGSGLTCAGRRGRSPRGGHGHPVSWCIGKARGL